MSFHGLIAFFFLVLSNIPFSECITGCLSTHPLKDSFCFQVLAAVSKAAINIHVQFFGALLGIEPMVSYMLGKCFTTSPICRFFCGHKPLTLLG
jgi:hypothetical protein